MLVTASPGCSRRKYATSNPRTKRKKKAGQAPQLDLQRAKQLKSLWPNMQHKRLTVIVLHVLSLSCINEWICLASICRGNQTLAKVKGGVSHQIWIFLEADCNGSCLLMQHAQAQRDILVMLSPFDLAIQRARLPTYLQLSRDYIIKHKKCMRRTHWTKTKKCRCMYIYIYANINIYIYIYLWNTYVNMNTTIQCILNTHPQCCQVRSPWKNRQWLWWLWTSPAVKQMTRIQRSWPLPSMFLLPVRLPDCVLPILSCLNTWAKRNVNLNSECNAGKYPRNRDPRERGGIGDCNVGK